MLVCKNTQMQLNCVYYRVLVLQKMNFSEYVVRKPKDNYMDEIVNIRHKGKLDVTIQKQISNTSQYSSTSRLLFLFS